MRTDRAEQPRVSPAKMSLGKDHDNPVSKIPDPPPHKSPRSKQDISIPHRPFRQCQRLSGLHQHGAVGTGIARLSWHAVVNRQADAAGAHAQHGRANDGAVSQPRDAAAVQETTLGRPTVWAEPSVGGRVEVECQELEWRETTRVKTESPAADSIRSAVFLFWVV